MVLVSTSGRVTCLTLAFTEIFSSSPSFGARTIKDRRRSIAPQVMPMKRKDMKMLYLLVRVLTTGANSVVEKA